MSRRFTIPGWVLTRGGAALILSILVIVGSAFFIWRQLARGHDRLPALVMYERTRSAVASLSMVPLDSEESIRGALTAASWDVRADIASTQRDALINLIVNLVNHYYLDFADDPADMLRWLEDQGYRMSTRAELEAQWPLGDRLSILSKLNGAPPLTVSAEDEIVDIYSWIRRALSAADNGVNSAVAIASSSDGIEISIGNVDSGEENPFGLGAGLDAEAWYGGIGQSSPGWVQPPVQRDQIIENNGKAIIGEIGIFFEFTGGIRYPVTFSVVWDPSVKRWVLLGVGVRNYPYDSGVATWQV